MEAVTLTCGCEVELPDGLDARDKPDYLSCKGMVSVRHFGPNEIAKCAKCKKEWEIH